MAVLRFVGDRRLGRCLRLGSAVPPLRTDEDEEHDEADEG